MDVSAEPSSPAATLAHLSERATLWLLVAILAWAPFPLGSNRPWSWSFLVLLIALAWLVWIPAGLGDSAATLRQARRVAVPGALLAGVLVWGWVQSAEFAPWHNSVWSAAARGLGHELAGAISIDPFASATELMKLASYVAIGWLAFALAARPENARTLLVAVFAVGVAYALYGLVLAALGTSQLTLFEGLSPPYGRDASGGFVAKNSFATFTGIALLAGLNLLVEAGRHAIVSAQGWRTHSRTLIQFAVGRGAPWLAGTLILLAALIASDSRAGWIASLVGLLAMFAIALAVSPSRKATLAGGAGAGLAILMLFVLNGATLQARFENLVETAGAGEIRAALWGVALRAIAAHPLQGLGLGTYSAVYPFYADGFVPYFVDRVHNDYLELALGIGIPAACLWVLALFILTGQCAHGALTRRRRRLYATSALGAAALVGFHSLFDFSLQMPAVSVLYAMVMGIGVAQAKSSRDGAAHPVHGARGR